MKNIDQKEFIALSNNDDTIILDVRRPDECASGMIPGAMPINYMDTALFESECNKLDKGKSYLVYCRSGNRSGKACQYLDANGFENTYNLLGGMLDWKGQTT